MTVFFQKKIKNSFRITGSSGRRQTENEVYGNIISSFHKPKQSYLNRHQINQIIIFVTYENSATAEEVKNYIKEKFSITYCAEAVRRLLIKNGLKVIRPRTVPGNPPSPEEQKKW